MGPGMAAPRSGEFASREVISRQGRPESVGYENVRMPVSSVLDPEIGPASQNREGAAPELGAVRRGFHAIDALRGANMVVAGLLCVTHFSQGHIGFGVMWGALSILWGGLIVFGSQKRRD